MQGTLKALGAATNRCPVGISQRCYICLEYEINVFTTLDMVIHRNVSVKRTSGYGYGIIGVWIDGVLIQTQVIEVLEHIKLVLVRSSLGICSIILIAGDIDLTVPLNVGMIHIHMVLLISHYA